MEIAVLPSAVEDRRVSADRRRKGEFGRAAWRRPCWKDLRPCVSRERPRRHARSNTHRY